MSCIILKFISLLRVYLEVNVACQSMDTDEDPDYEVYEWSVDSDDDGHLPDAIIEKVARANTVHNEHSQILPEIRAAPCPIHTKKDHKDPLKTDGRSPRRLTTHEPHDQLNVHTSTNKGCRMDINIRIPEQFPATVRQPMLPKNMTSKEYVMTWLVHGSEPNGNNHFPEIIPRRKKSLKVKMPDVKNS